MSILQDKPYVRQVPSHWKCLDWTPEVLAEILNDTKLTGRIASNSHDILDENGCDKVSAPLSAFLDMKKIWYCSYLRMSDMSIDPVQWSDIGLTDTGGDACLWVGSSGSGTALHRDSYGWNCVCQLHGRKLWKLAPMRTTDILSTRVPFEESTVWGRNYDIAQCADTLAFCLKPGDMLVIPPGWWHSVTSLDTSIAVNIWTSSPQTDNEAREIEAATRIVSQICKESKLIR